MLACYATLIGVALNGFLSIKTYYSNYLLIMTEENDNYNFKQAEKRLFPELADAYRSITVIKFDEEGFKTERAQLL